MLLREFIMICTFKILARRQVLTEILYSVFLQDNQGIHTHTSGYHHNAVMNTSTSLPPSAFLLPLSYQPIEQVLMSVSEMV